MGEPLGLWSNHRQHNPPLLQHQHRQFGAPPQPGPIVSSRSTGTHSQATSVCNLCMQPSVPATSGHKPAQPLPAVSLQIERPMTPLPTQPQQQEQQISDTPVVPVNQQITRSGRVVQGLCPLLGGQWKARNSRKSKPSFANSVLWVIDFSPLVIDFF